jgi:hypothetical protein
MEQLLSLLVVGCSTVNTQERQATFDMEQSATGKLDRNWLVVRKHCEDLRDRG